MHLWELTGGKAEVVIHEADAPMLRSRRAHVKEYLDGRGRYLHDPEGEAKQIAVTESAHLRRDRADDGAAWR